MSVSKRLRFEVLRRDNYTCRYCGAKAPDVRLHIDHVVPESLGGSDDPSNLATACQDCNGGKGASSPDAASVAEAEMVQSRWREAMALAAAEIATSDWEKEEYVAAFCEAWPSYYGLTASMEQDLMRLCEQGLPVAVMVQSVGVAIGARHVVGKESKYRYFRAVCRNRLEEIRDRAAQMMSEAL